MRFEFHSVRPKQFLSLWYVRRKLCTYLASRLALSPNGPKWVSTWASSPRSTIGCIQNDFYAYGTLAQSCTYTNTISKCTEMIFHITHVTYEFHQVRSKRFLSLLYVRREPCTYCASRLALSPNGPKPASTWVSSSSNSIRGIQNNFLAYGTFAEPVHLSCTYTDTVSKQTEMRFEFHPVRPKQFSEPMVCLAQAMHLSCIKIISKRTELSFHLSLVT
jgi:hypothetical protein